MRIVRWALVALLAALVGVGAWVMQQRGLHGPIARAFGPATTIDRLSLRPVLFASTDYRFVPTTVRAEEGRLSVPQNRARPDGRTVDLHFVRFAATGADRGPPTVYLADGPSIAATVKAAGASFEFLMQLRRAGDVIVLDQRGTLYSPPALWCDSPFEFPFDEVTTLQRHAPAVATYLRDCMREWGEVADIGAFNPRESARDIEDVRIAIGTDRINLVTGGFGTQVALDYLRLYPERVASAVLAGVGAPHQVYKLPANVDAAFGRIAAAIGRALPTRFASFADNVAEVLNAAEGERVSVLLDLPGRPEVVLGRVDLTAWLYARMASRAAIATLPRGIGRLQIGDYRELAREVYASRQGASVSLTAIAMACAAGVSGQRRTLITEQAEAALLGDIANLPLHLACDAWTGPVQDETYREPVITDVFALVISGTLDPRSTLEDADDVLEGLANGTQLVIEGAGGGDDLLLSSPFVAQAVLAFLRGAPLPIERIVLAPITFQQP